MTPVSAAEWNRRYPIGTPVTAYPGERGGRALRTTTRSRAWDLGTVPVVLVWGKTGGIALTHVDLRDPVAETAQLCEPT